MPNGPRAPAATEFSAEEMSRWITG